MFYDYRPGTGPTLVFLHYWGGSARTWAPVIDRLEGRGTLSIDFRGWGRSGACPAPTPWSNSPTTSPTSSINPV